MPANWVLMAIPLALLVAVYYIYDGIRNHREQSYLHHVYDGDRIEQWRNDKRNRNRKWKLTAHHGRYFY